MTVQQTKHWWEWLDLWRDIYAKPNVEPGTFISYSNAVKQLKQTMPNIEISKLTEMDCQLSLNLLCDLGYSKSTLKTARTVLRQSFQKARKNHLLEDNPATELVIPVQAGTRDIKALTVEEQRIVEITCYDDLHGDHILFLLYTGLRRNEFRNLKWTDYDRKKRTIQIRKSKTKNGIRNIPLLPICEMIICLQPKTNEYIFTTKAGEPVTESSLKKTYLRIRRKTGVMTLTNHVCRHTFATRLVEQGVEPKALATLLGHASPYFSMTRYTDAQEEHLSKQVYLLSPLTYKQFS